MQETNQNSKKWYAGRPAKQAFAARVAEIQKYRTPATKADEFLLIVRLLILPLLAVWCIVISFATARAFLGHNFGEPYATIGAAILCLVIEIGKMKFGSYTFSKLFLEGLDGIQERFAEAAMWGFITLFATACFIGSFLNSTHGAESLALLRGNQAHYEEFKPNTSDLDSQIAAADSRINANSGIKWKGTVTYQAQQAIKSDSRSITSLNAQREQRVNEQRADYERRRAQMDETTTKGAKIVFAAGGYVEILQIISLVLMAACMRVVGDHLEREHSNVNQTAAQNISFARNNAFNSQQTNNSAPSVPQVFMFNRIPGGNVRAAGTDSVPQFSQAVAQKNAVMGCNDILARCKESIQRDLPNFGRKDARQTTVNDRITLALDKCLDNMNIPGFCPDREAAINFYDFLTHKAFPELNLVGWPYQRESIFLKTLSGFIPETV